MRTVKSAVHKASTRQCDGVWTSPAGTPLMIIERIQQKLIMRVHWIDVNSAGDAEAEESGHLVVRSRLWHTASSWLGRQNIQQGRTGDQAMITALSARSRSSASTLPSMITVSSGSGSDRTDGRVMIKMDPPLLKGKAGRQPPLVGTGPGTEIDDLQDAGQTAGVDQIVDQLGEEGARPWRRGRRCRRPRGRQASLGRRWLQRAIQVRQHRLCRLLPSGAAYLAERAPPAAMSAAASVR